MLFVNSHTFPNCPLVQPSFLPVFLNTPYYSQVCTHSLYWPHFGGFISSTAGVSFLVENVTGKSLETCQHPERDTLQPEECGRNLEQPAPCPELPEDSPGLGEQDGLFSPSGTAFPLSKKPGLF